MYIFVFLYTALDLQSCGITTEGASHFQEVLRLNATLIVLDLRANVLLGIWTLYVYLQLAPLILYTVVSRKRAQYQISAHSPLLLQFPTKV